MDKPDKMMETHVGKIVSALRAAGFSAKFKPREGRIVCDMSKVGMTAFVSVSGLNQSDVFVNVNTDGRGLLKEDKYDTQAWCRKQITSTINGVFLFNERCDDVE